MPESSVNRRLERLRRARVGGGLLPVDETAALMGVGFEPVSEVVGAVANAVIPGGFYGSGAPMMGSAYYRNPDRAAADAELRTYTSSSNNLAVGTPATITALKSGYRTALTRMEEEAAAVGADGVVAISLAHDVGHDAQGQIWTFLAVGTAIRSKGDTHTDRPFTTLLNGAESAAAVRSGWLPVAVLVNPVLAVRWVEPAARSRKRRLAPNAEINAYTDLVNTCRRQARTDFERSARQVHADGAVMSELTLRLHLHDESCIAMATITGSALAKFRVAPAPPPLTIIPLSKGSR